MQNTALPNGFIAGDARGCGQELSPPSLRVLPLPRSALAGKGATRPPRRRLSCMFTDCERWCIHVATYVQLWSDRLSAHEKARGEAVSAAQSGPALWVVCPVPSCSFSVVVQHSSVGNGANKKGGSTGINTVVEVLSKNLKTLLLFNFYGFFFFLLCRTRKGWRCLEQDPGAAILCEQHFAKESCSLPVC